MNEFQIALLIGAAITVLISWKIPHSLLWVCLGAADAAACDLWYSYGLVYPAAFTLAADALLCLTIDWLANERWEFKIFNLYRLSVLISVFNMLGIIASGYVYATMLELIDWAVLLQIGGTGIMGRVGGSGYFFHYRWRAYFSHAYSRLRSPRKSPHWARGS